MGLSLLSLSEANAAVARGLDMSPAASPQQIIAESLRRAASLLCPTAPSTLVATVLRSLQPLADGDSWVDSDVSDVLETLIGIGDLVEGVDEIEGARRRVVYLGGPRYVRRESGDFVLIGVRPDGAPLVGDELTQRIEHTGHLRRVTASDDLADLMADYGVHEVKAARWLRAPAVVAADAVVDVYDRCLAVATRSGYVADLRILDPQRPTSYYRGRWRPVSTDDTGRFVARRSQGYGADLWCYVEVENGDAQRLVDLPAIGRDRGCDEAWRLQAAIDASRGHPQTLMVTGTGSGGIRIGLQAPPPRWLQRRWDLFGRQHQAKGVLFAYDFPPADAREEITFITEQLWLVRNVAAKDD